MFNFSVLDLKKNNIKWGRAVKKTFEKKNIEPIFGNVSEGAEIKKTFDKFLEKLMRATK